MPFSGFPLKVQFTRVPDPVFGPLLEEVEDIVELKCILRTIWLVNQKKGTPRPVGLEEIQTDQILVRALAMDPDDAAEVIGEALRKAVGRGALLEATATQNGVKRIAYLLNIEPERRAIERQDDLTIEDDRFLSPGSGQGARKKPNVYALYESNIGMLTPLIAEELKEAEALYPKEWIEDAFREAVSMNKRSWRYISRILERWSREGRDYAAHGEPWGHIKKADPKRYLRL